MKKFDRFLDAFYGFFDTSIGRWVKTLIEIAILAAVVVLICTFFNGFAKSEQEYDSYAWVMCDPESYVCIHEKPKKTSWAFGGVTFGTMLKTDGRIENGFLHLIDLSAECETGWISTQFIVYDEPEILMQKAQVVSNGRLAARKGIFGKIRKWLKPMTELTIRVRSNEWCLTNYGYVQTEFLDYVGE